MGDLVLVGSLLVSGSVYLNVYMCLSSVSDREAALEAALKLMQNFYLDLEKFLSWLTEAETTCNVLIDATNKERLQEQPAARNLLAQWKVGCIHKLTSQLHILRCNWLFSVCYHSSKSLSRCFWCTPERKPRPNSFCPLSWSRHNQHILQFTLSYLHK